MVDLLANDKDKDFPKNLEVVEVPYIMTVTLKVKRGIKSDAILFSLPFFLLFAAQADKLPSVAIIINYLPSTTFQNCYSYNK